MSALEKVADEEDWALELASRLDDDIERKEGFVKRAGDPFDRHRWARLLECPRRPRYMRMRVCEPDLPVEALPALCARVDCLHLRDGHHVDDLRAGPSAILHMQGILPYVFGAVKNAPHLHTLILQHAAWLSPNDINTFDSHLANQSSVFDDEDEVSYTNMMVRSIAGLGGCTQLQKLKLRISNRLMPRLADALTELHMLRSLVVELALSREYLPRPTVFARLNSAFCSALQSVKLLSEFELHVTGTRVPDGQALYIDIERLVRACARPGPAGLQSFRVTMERDDNPHCFMHCRLSSLCQLVFGNPAWEQLSIRDVQASQACLPHLSGQQTDLPVPHFRSLYHLRFDDVGVEVIDAIVRPILERPELCPQLAQLHLRPQRHVPLLVVRSQLEQRRRWWAEFCDFLKTNVPLHPNLTHLDLHANCPTVRVPNGITEVIAHLGRMHCLPGEVRFMVDDFETAQHEVDREEDILFETLPVLESTRAALEAHTCDELRNLAAEALNRESLNQQDLAIVHAFLMHPPELDTDGVDLLWNRAYQARLMHESDMIQAIIRGSLQHQDGAQDSSIDKRRDSGDAGDSDCDCDGNGDESDMDEAEELAREALSCCAQVSSLEFRVSRAFSANTARAVLGSGLVELDIRFTSHPGSEYCWQPEPEWDDADNSYPDVPRTAEEFDEIWWPRPNQPIGRDATLATLSDAEPRPDMAERRWLRSERNYVSLITDLLAAVKGNQSLQHLYVGHDHNFQPYRLTQQLFHPILRFLREDADKTALIRLLLEVPFDWHQLLPMWQTIVRRAPKLTAFGLTVLPAPTNWRQPEVKLPYDALWRESKETTDALWHEAVTAVDAARPRISSALTGFMRDDLPPNDGLQRCMPPALRHWMMNNRKRVFAARWHWGQKAILIAFVRANRGSPLQYSVLPLIIETCYKLIGLDEFMTRYRLDLPQHL